MGTSKENSSSQNEETSEKNRKSKSKRLARFYYNRRWSKEKLKANKKGSNPKITTTKKNTSAKTTRIKQLQADKKKEKKQLDPEVIKSKLKERIDSIPPSEKKAIRLEWPSKSISLTDEEFVAKKVVVDGYYGPLNAQQMGEIEACIKSTEMTVPQALSLRSAILQQKAMYRCGSLRRQAKKVYNLYRKGQTVLDLAHKFDQPPMNVLRVILTEMKWSKAQIKKALRDPKQFENRERKEFLVAESMDLVSMVNQSEIHQHSDKFEDILSDWLKKNRIRFVRQKQLEEEQKKEFGKAIVTPDFLLLDQILINGRPCHWIDCKAFYGANLESSVQNTKKQMARYIDHWGSGAIIYLQGCCGAIQIQDCLLLNAHGVLDFDSLSTLEAKIVQAKNIPSLTSFNTEEKRT